ncbi:hypothetical protein [Roseburia inulinivorans]|jgi:hypothetical protein|uniref:hypothetical protein n=1 Tax=Roseburia inulinivorans TaxID=360807 RepID=UPI003AB3CEFF
MKIKLGNNTEIAIKKVVPSDNTLSIVLENMLLDSLDTEFRKNEALEKLELISDSENIIGRYYNMEYSSIYKEENDIVITLTFKKTMASADVSKQISEIRNNLDDLKNEVTNTQNLQDDAIQELADLTSSLSENINIKESEA